MRIDDKTISQPVLIIEPKDIHPYIPNLFWEYLSVMSQNQRYHVLRYLLKDDSRLKDVTNIGGPWHNWSDYDQIVFIDYNLKKMFRIKHVGPPRRRVTYPNPFPIKKEFPIDRFELIDL